MKNAIYIAQVFTSLGLLVGTMIYVGMNVFCSSALVLTVIQR